MGNRIDYGSCSCGEKLNPVFFKEKEYDDFGIPTGRTRMACSHLLCEYCGKSYAVDDTFDGPWSK